MTTFEPGDLVLIALPFTSGAGSKQRPGLIVFDAGDSDIIVTSITTQLRSSPFDVTILEWQSAGLLAPSTARLHKLATLEKGLVRRRLGRLVESDWASAARTIRQVFH
jgi:mRNA interferase MazF